MGKEAKVAKPFVAEGGVEVTDELLDEWAKPYEMEKVPGRSGGFVTAPGRPRISEEENRIISVRLPISVIEAVDHKAQRLGQTRSQRLREAIVADALNEA